MLQITLHFKAYLYGSFCVTALFVMTLSFVCQCQFLVSYLNLFTILKALVITISLYPVNSETVLTLT